MHEQSLRYSSWSGELGSAGNVHKVDVPQVIKDTFPPLKLFGKCDEVDKWFERNPEMVQREGGQKVVRKGDGSPKCQLGKSEI